MKGLLLLLLCSAILAGCGGGAKAPSGAPETDLRFEVRNLGMFPGGDTIIGTGINEAGEVTGYAVVGGLSTLDAMSRIPPPYGLDRAFLWREGGFAELDDRFGERSTPKGINDVRDIAGMSDGRAIIWRNGAPEIIAESMSSAEAVNDHGWVVGWKDDRGFLWDGSELVWLSSIEGADQYPSDINNLGQVVGKASDFDPSHSAYAAFLWQAGRMTKLRMLSGGTSSNASAINDSGWVVGFSSNSTLNERAVLWRDGNVTDLGTLGGQWSKAADVNNAGWVVGASRVPGGPDEPPHAFLWYKGAMYDLNNLVSDDPEYILCRGVAVNDAGQILCLAQENGQSPLSTVLLTPKMKH